MFEIPNELRVLSPCLFGNRIGWNHDAPNISNVDDYEESRGPRKVNMEFVLGRSEREALLMEWNVDMKTIAESTRAANKAKSERRQTFINSRKLSKLEAVMEMTSKKLMNALLPTRRFNFGPEKPSESTSSEVFASDLSGAGDTVSITSVGDSEDIKSRSQTNDKIIEKLMNTSLDDPSTGRLDESDGGASNYDDFTLGATTLGNASAFSPSVIEMDKFYRELELEMFGEEIELPSMIGQTLEVPQDIERIDSNNTRSENAKIQDETLFYENAISNLQSSHLEGHPNQSQRDSYSNTSLHYAQHTYEDYGGPIRQYEFMETLRDQRHVPPQRTYLTGTDPYSTCNGSMSSPGSQYPIIQRPAMTFSRSEPVQNYTQGSPRFDQSMHFPRDGYQRNSRQRGASFDSAYDLAPGHGVNHYLSPASQGGPVQTCFEYEHIPTASSLDAAESSVQHSDPDPHFSGRRSSRRKTRRSGSGGPRVHHMPERGSFSSHEWRDGRDRQPSSCNNNGTVIITED